MDDIDWLFTPARRSAPYWQRSHSAYSLACLPAGFESICECETRRWEILDAFVSGKQDTLWDRLFRCIWEVESCRLPCCPICARSFRQWFIPRIHQLAASIPAASIMTILLENVRAGNLRDHDISAAKKRMRTILDRAGCSGAVLVGGIEAGFRASTQQWTVHLHLLVSGLTKSAETALRGQFRKIHGKHAVKIQPLRDQVQQLSYLLKFVTYHRPLSRNGASPSRSCPIPPKALLEWCDWIGRTDVDDLMFIYGARVVKGEIQPKRKLRGQKAL